MGAPIGDEETNDVGFPAIYADPRRLGSGAEGGTWLATDRGTGHRVVLKRVPSERTAQVQRAFELLRSVGSPHLPAPRALTPGATDDDAQWLATDFVDGTTLPTTATDPPTALRECLAVAHALAAIHRTGTHHGDVSPGNVIVTRTGGVILVDLGQLGQLGSGTPGFLAPEVLAGGGGAPSDRFALGCLLCLRLFGEVPWRRPDALVRVRDCSDVDERLNELAADEDAMSHGLRALLRLLLHPEPSQRLAAPELLVARLAGLLRAAEAGVDLPAKASWWLPQRWPYRHGPGGPNAADLAQRLAPHDRPRLVAIAGPVGVGRGRVIEELVQTLQSRGVGPRALACDPERAGALVGRPDATWVEAWLQPAEAEGTVLGLVAEPPWPRLAPDGAADAGERGAAAHAALLLDAATSATATLIVPVGQRLALALEQGIARGVAPTQSVVVVRVRPWDPSTVALALAEVLHCDEPAAWSRALIDATGGWPGRMVRAVTACAIAGVDSPSPAAVERALEAAPSGSVLGVDDAVASEILLAWWCGDGDRRSRVPSHLFDGQAPRAAAVAAARRQLSTQIRALARHTHAQRTAAALPIALTLAVDADLPRAVESALLADYALPLSRAGSATALQWLLDGGAATLGDEAVAVACRGLLAEGDARRALTLAALHPDGSACRLEAARAAQRLGQPNDALDHLAYVGGEDPDRRAAAIGLRWRLRVDRGQAAEAAAEARLRLGSVPPTGLGAGTAHLWGAMAALMAGDTDVAQTWLDQAQASVEPLLDRAGSEAHATERAGSVAAAAAGLVARVRQLRGNVAQSQGDLAAAHHHYAAAALSFERAAEPVGSLLVRGSLAGLAIPTFATTRGIDDGRAALRGLVVRGQLSATLEAALNLVQLLCRIGATEAARGIAALADALFASRRSLDPRVRGRLSRIDAELSAAAGPVRAAEDAFVAAAVDLHAADGAREAVEAWLRAAVCARKQSALDRAAAHLERALSVGADDDDSRATVAIEALELACARAAVGAAAVGPGAANERGAATDHRAAIDRALLAVRAIGEPDTLSARGRLDLAWAAARATALALHQRLAAGHPARRKATRRLVTTLDNIMKQTDPLDRPAVRASLTSEVGDRSALRELLAELDADGASSLPLSTAEPAAAPVANADAAARVSGLLRVYRRLAREDRLEVLLQQFIDAMMELTDAERGAVVILPQAGTASTERLEVTRELSAVGEGVRFSRSVIDRVLADGDPVLSVDAAHDDRFDGSRSISHLNLRSVLAVPLRFRGELFGAAYVDHRLRRGAFDETDLAQMEEFADLAALAVAHARALAALRSQAQQLESQRERLAGMLEATEAEVEGLRGRVRNSAAAPDDTRHGMIGNSPGMQRVFRLIERLADSDVPVVIHGESGTGKELVAHAIHDAGPRRTGPFVAENCGAIPETLLESVLFGHARGAFTGASKSKAGLFEAANGGTIFLDEVGEMSPGMQTKLLRVLQEGEVRRVGENDARVVDVRVIAASNRDLEALVASGAFRSDLYYRIHVVKLVLPALRERTDDLPALIRHFAARHGAASLSVAPAAMKLLCRYAWPGNVRELDNEVQRWIALSEGEVGIDDLSAALTERAIAAPDLDDLQIRPRVDRLERELIGAALERTGNNQTKAATLLGLSRFGLQKKLRRMGEEDAEDPAEGSSA